MSLTYSECLWDDTKGTKSNRNVVNGKLMRGVKDSIISNGKERQIYRTLSWRTYRYVQLTINTHDAPLTLYDLYGIFTGYPLQLASTFECQDKELERILQTGWHTARLCAWETYMDCPYYEQLQYLGDSRIQALITLFNSCDDRLVKRFHHEPIPLYHGAKYPHLLAHLYPLVARLYALRERSRLCPW